MFFDDQKLNRSGNDQPGRKIPPPDFSKKLSSEIETFEGGFNKTAQLDHGFFSPGGFSSSDAGLGGDRKCGSSPGGCEGESEFQREKRRGEKKIGKQTPQKTIDKRAKRKGFAVALGKAMVKYAKEVGSPMIGTYYRTMGCCDTLHQVDGKLITKYCKSRICPICGAIRTAKAIDAYFPIIRGWDAYLVTLTIPNVADFMLKDTISEMFDDFRNAQRSIKRRLVFKGVRKLEVTYNPVKNNFHAHFHVIVDGFAQAQRLRDEWLQRHPEAKQIGQDVRRCDKRTLKEVFKYAMKILGPDEEGKGQSAHLYPHAVDTIVRALWKRRTYQNFGFRLPKAFDEDDFDGEALQAPDSAPINIATWVWLENVHNWVNKETGELLSFYVPSKRRLKFLSGLDPGT